MKFSTTLAALFCLMTACGPVPQEQETREDFATTDPSRIYFRNMRSTKYKESKQPGTRTQLYRFERFPDTNERPIIMPVIANNWMRDEAYLFVETNAYRNGYRKPLVVFHQHESQEDTFELLKPRLAEQQQFSVELYRRLGQGGQMETLDSLGNRIGIFDNKLDVTNYRTVVKDYLRLIERE